MTDQTPWIQNVALSDVKRGLHIEPGPNAMLIQIVDPDLEFPTPMKEFREIHQFKFLDIEEDNTEFSIKQQEAEQLVELLQHALENRMNVIVHCVAGVCRSGAVCELGVMMGFRDTEVFRSPNLLVKHKMMRKLGWTYDEDEPHTVNGVPLDPDWTDDNEKVFMLSFSRKEWREREGDI
jgi:protein tyrosine phosphatase